jgi:hypothetical protein
MTDFVQRHVPGYGWLPIVIVDNKEVYRGEFQRTSFGAQQKCDAAIVRYRKELLENTGG